MSLPAKSENNRRVRDGIAMFWLCKTKKWVYDKKLPGVAFAPPNQHTQEAALAVAPTLVVQQQQYNNDDQRKSAREAALSNVSHALTWH